MLIDIIQCLLDLIQYLYQQNCWLILFICKYITLKQWAHNDSHSPKYQKFKIDELPRIDNFKQDWDFKDLLAYFKERYGKEIKPVFRCVKCDTPKDCTWLACNARVLYLSWNDGKKKLRFVTKSARTISRLQTITDFPKSLNYATRTVPTSLFSRKTRNISLCINKQCPFYLHNLKKVDKKIWQKILEKVNTNFITSTENFR